MTDLAKFRRELPEEHKRIIRLSHRVLPEYLDDAVKHALNDPDWIAARLAAVADVGLGEYGVHYHAWPNDAPHHRAELRIVSDNLTEQWTYEVVYEKSHVLALQAIYIKAYVYLTKDDVLPQDDGTEWVRPKETKAKHLAALLGVEVQQ